MRIANHISPDGLTTKLSAYKAEYQDYAGHIECLECFDRLKFVEGYLRGKTWVSACFRHTEQHSEDCKLRSSSFSSPDGDVFDIISKGQSSSKLRLSFLKCFRFYVSGCYSPFAYKNIGLIPFMSLGYGVSQRQRSIRLNELIGESLSPGVIHENPKLVLDTFSTLLKSRHSEPVIERLLERVRNKLIRDQDSLYYFVKKSKKHDISKKKLIGIHVEQVAMVLRFIRKDASEKLRLEFLEIAIGGFSSTGQFSYRHDNRNIFFEKVRELDSTALENLGSSALERKKAFSKYADSPELPEAEIIQVVLERAVFSVMLFNWTQLSAFYHEGSARYPLWMTVDAGRWISNS